MGLNWEPKLVYKITSGLVIILILENLKNLGSQLFYAYLSKKKKTFFMRQSIGGNGGKKNGCKYI